LKSKMSISTNTKLNRVPPEARALAVRNLPLSIPIILGLSLIIIFVIPIVLRYLFPEFQNTNTIVTIILTIYVLILILIMSKNYHNRTGKDIAKELNKIQYEHDLKKYGKEGLEKKRKIDKVLLFVGPWFITLISVAMLVWASNPPKWIYIVAVVSFLFPIVIKLLEKGKNN